MNGRVEKRKSGGNVRSCKSSRHWQVHRHLAGRDSSIRGSTWNSEMIELRTKWNQAEEEKKTLTNDKKISNEVNTANSKKSKSNAPNDVKVIHTTKVDEICHSWLTAGWGKSTPALVEWRRWTRERERAKTVTEKMIPGKELAERNYSWWRQPPCAKTREHSQR